MAATNKDNLTNIIAMDCEMVGIGRYGIDNMLARVSIVNSFGDCIYDKHVKPQENVTDYRTDVSGVTKEDLEKGEDFSTVQKEVANILRGRILVGHAVMNDFDVLKITHPRKQIRDTSRYHKFRMITNGSTPALKKLANKVLGMKIQRGPHSSIEDARATMKLYHKVATEWENSLKAMRR